jgi:hypothetical protein
VEREHNKAFYQARGAEVDDTVLACRSKAELAEMARARSRINESVKRHQSPFVSPNKPREHQGYQFETRERMTLDLVSPLIPLAKPKVDIDYPESRKFDLPIHKRQFSKIMDFTKQINREGQSYDPENKEEPQYTGKKKKKEASQGLQRKGGNRFAGMLNVDIVNPFKEMDKQTYYLS